MQHYYLQASQLSCRDQLESKVHRQQVHLHIRHVSTLLTSRGGNYGPPDEWQSLSGYQHCVDAGCMCKDTEGCIESPWT